MYLGYGRHISGGMAALWWGVGFGVLIVLCTTWSAVRQMAWLRGRRLGGPAIGFDTVHLPDVTKASVHRRRKVGVDVLQLNIDSEVLDLATCNPQGRALYSYYDRRSLVAIADALALSSEPSETTADNGTPECRRHHREKHETGWTIHREDHRIIWTSPDGKTLINEPQPLQPVGGNDSPPF